MVLLFTPWHYTPCLWVHGAYENVLSEWFLYSVDSRALPAEKNSKNRFPNENAYFRWHGTDCRKCRRSTAAGENATVIRGTDTRITCKELLFSPFQIYWPIQTNTKDGFICVDGQIWRPNQRMIRAKQDGKDSANLQFRGGSRIGACCRILCVLVRLSLKYNYTL